MGPMRYTMLCHAMLCYAMEVNSAALIRDAAVDFIGRQTDAKPFFLYLPFQNIHGPYTSDEVYRHPYNDSSRFTPGEVTMFAYISELDDAVGHVVHALRQAKRYDSSLVVFSSDNGAPPASEDVDHTVPGQPGWIARNYPCAAPPSRTRRPSTRPAPPSPPRSAPHGRYRGHKALIW